MAVHVNTLHVPRALFVREQDTNRVLRIERDVTKVVPERERERGRSKNLINDKRFFCNKGDFKRPRLSTERFLFIKIFNQKKEEGISRRGQCISDSLKTSTKIKQFIIENRKELCGLLDNKRNQTAFPFGSPCLGSYQFNSISLSGYNRMSTFLLLLSVTILFPLVRFFLSPSEEDGGKRTQHQVTTTEMCAFFPHPSIHPSVHSFNPRE